MGLILPLDGIESSNFRIRMEGHLVQPPLKAGPTSTKSMERGSFCEPGAAPKFTAIQPKYSGLP